MVDKEAAERAFANPNPIIEGRRANVNLAYIGAKPKMNGPPGIILCIPVSNYSECTVTSFLSVFSLY